MRGASVVFLSLVLPSTFYAQSKQGPAFNANDARETEAWYKLQVVKIFDAAINGNAFAANKMRQNMVEAMQGKKVDWILEVDEVRPGNKIKIQVIGNDPGKFGADTRFMLIVSSPPTEPALFKAPVILSFDAPPEDWVLELRRGSKIRMKATIRTVRTFREISQGIVNGFTTLRLEMTEVRMGPPR